MRKFTLLCVAMLMAVVVVAQNETTAFMRQLQQVKGVSGVTKLDSRHYPEKYVMKIRQMVDGDTDEKGTFDQRIIVCLKGLDRPTVLVTEGYFAHYALQPNYEDELSRLFNANVIVCEYRYFAESVPEPCNWDYLTVDNSLRDYHRIRQAFDEVFKGKWISTGISKGGQTTMFYRATYPDDVDISVSYVAPLNRALEDGRHEKFLEKEVGTKEERDAILRAQQELMQRKAKLLPFFDAYAKEKKLTFSLSNADVFDFCVMELPFALWQWGSPVSAIPAPDATDKVWFDYLIETSGADYFSCPSDFTPFYVQAARELGYYGYSRKGLKQWQSISTSKGYLPQLMLPEGLRDIRFDKTLYKRTVKFLKENDPKHIFIYGEIDPWTSSGVAGWLDCSDKENMRVYVEPRGSHKARINTMPDHLRTEIMDRLTKWLDE